MKNLFILLLLLPLSLFGQKKRDSVYVKTDIFEVGYSETKEQPTWIRYEVKCPDGSAPRKGLDFYKAPGYFTSDNEDYANNEWDKGHMAPAADFNCTLDMLKKTFSYLNCALQQENLNRGAWRLLEARERKLAASANVTVIIDVIFTRESVVLPTGATIPTAFYKEIRYGSKKECYYFPNKKPATTDFTVFKCNCR
jgi:endonuclease G, mitochondrial